MDFLKYPSQQVLTADWLWNLSFFPWPFLHLLFSFSGFPLLLLSPMTFAISLHLASIHSFSIFPSCSCQFQSSCMPLFLILSLSCIIFFPSNIPTYFSFTHLPTAFYLPPLIVTWNKKWCYDKRGAISSTAIDLFCIAPLSCPHSFFLPVALMYLIYRILFFFLPFH